MFLELATGYFLVWTQETEPEITNPALIFCPEEAMWFLMAWSAEQSREVGEYLEGRVRHAEFPEGKLSCLLLILFTFTGIYE